MIQEFTVKNYRSIKTKQTISFLANKKMNNGREDYLCTQVNDNTKLLKFSVLYGYNAAGKSNILLAMDFLRDLILFGPDTKNEETGFVPFALDNESINKSGEFSLIFFIEGIKYEYSVTLDKKRIHFESLDYTPLNRKAKLFSRTFDDEKKISKIVIGAGCKLLSKDKLILNGNTLENSTVLYSYQRSNIHSSVLDKVVSYFKNTLLPIITPSSLLINWSMNKLVKDNTQKDFYVKLLGKADFQISDLEIKEDKIEVTDEMLATLQEQGLPSSLIKSMEDKKTVETKELLFSHSTKNGTHKISQEEESKGTQRYFSLGGVLKELINSSKVIAIDEIEASLHPDLVAFFLQMFLMNTQNSQLLVTTHNQFIMDQDYMRNDMIWFCEKDEEGASNYYCAQDFKLHKNVILSNFYRAGKLGAVPELGSPIIQEE